MLTCTGRSTSVTEIKYELNEYHRLKYSFRITDSSNGTTKLK